MKPNKIYMNPWLKFNYRTKEVDTDAWYLAFANSLLPLVMTADFLKEKETNIQATIACALTAYLADCVADAGNWRHFSRWHSLRYNRDLPFYHTTDSYVPDEINWEDIALVLWLSDIKYTAGKRRVKDPLNPQLLAFAHLIYDRMDVVFEAAPVCDPESLSPDWFIQQKYLDAVPAPPPPHRFSGKMLPSDAELLLHAGGGKPLAFIDTYPALKHYLVDTLLWDNDPDNLLPELADHRDFVLFGNAKGLLVAPDIAPYFAYPTNPMYDPQRAEKEAYRMFCEPKVCPFDLLKYGTGRKLFPDAALPFPNGKALLHENWDFLAFLFLGKYYEGE